MAHHRPSKAKAGRDARAGPGKQPISPVRNHGPPARSQGPSNRFPVLVQASLFSTKRREGDLAFGTYCSGFTFYSPDRELLLPSLPQRESTGAQRVERSREAACVGLGPKASLKHENSIQSIHPNSCRGCCSGDQQGRLSMNPAPPIFPTPLDSTNKAVDLQLAGCDV